jgi:hypothetical protein
MVGIPRGLDLPLDFGIYTLLNGLALYPFLVRDEAAFSFCDDLDQTTPSTPGVFFPLFPVTLFTASNLA